MQSWPPLDGGGLVQLLKRRCTPFPQVTEQPLQISHWVKLPSTSVRTKATNEVTSHRKVAVMKITTGFDLIRNPSSVAKCEPFRNSPAKLILPALFVNIFWNIKKSYRDNSLREKMVVNSGPACSKNAQSPVTGPVNKSLSREQVLPKDIALPGAYS